jgi:formylmethanofuran dehydrogenase subunit E
MDIKDLEQPRQEIEDALAGGDLHMLLRVTGLIHGHYCPGSALGVKAAACAVRESRLNTSVKENLLAIVETNSCFADGVQMVTGCSLGNNALIYRDFGKMALTLTRQTGEAVRVAGRPGGPSPLERFPEAAALFRKVQERRSTAEETAELKKRWTDVAFKMLDIPDEELFSITHIRIEVPAYTRASASVKCAICGDSITESRARLKGGQPVCLSCSGDAYYQLAGNGLSLISR